MRRTKERKDTENIINCKLKLQVRTEETEEEKERRVHNELMHDEKMLSCKTITSYTCNIYYLYNN